jgi:hypothetical protein
MPGDPKECRKHAARCAEMAVAARTLQLKATFLELSKNWRNLQSNWKTLSPNLPRKRLLGRTSKIPSTRLAGFEKRYFEDYTTFDRSGHRIPHWPFKFRACLRGQSAVISSEHSKQLGVNAIAHDHAVEPILTERAAFLTLDPEDCELAQSGRGR